MNTISTEGLPKGLIEQLRLGRTKRNTMNDKVFNAAMSVCDQTSNWFFNIDQLLIEYYRQTGEIMKRNTMIAIMNRLSTEKAGSKFTRIDRGIYEISKDYREYEL